ncbi:hypothetical protein ACFC08_24770 [Streptomyces sp. NPDC056112]|uniref:hypothetical protein n=1 Tax=unclassified Streptomyces TaxID=2593676 RepID=UPI001CD450A3|nr:MULTISPECIES: hypothetical protein [unclassified Streptomyces]
MSLPAPAPPPIPSGTDFARPSGAGAAVSFTFDVDAEAGRLGEGEAYARHLHLLGDKVSAAEQRAGIEKGPAALTAAGAPVPAGHRSASWEPTPETFGLLTERGFGHDSVIGRPQRFAELARLVGAVAGDGRAWTAPLADVTAYAHPLLPPPSAPAPAVDR